MDSNDSFFFPSCKDAPASVGSWKWRKNMRNVEHEHKNGSMNVMVTNVKFHDINDG